MLKIEISIALVMFREAMHWWVEGQGANSIEDIINMGIASKMSTY